jgi:hypothetical protein
MRALCQLGLCRPLVMSGPFCARSRRPGGQGDSNGAVKPVTDATASVGARRSVVDGGDEITIEALRL